MWLSMASLVSRIQTFTYPSLSHLVSRCQASRLLFSDAWFIIVKSLLILLQLPSWLTHLFVSSISTLLKLFFMLNMNVDICLVDFAKLLPLWMPYTRTCSIWSFFFYYDHTNSVGQSNIHYLLVHNVFHAWLVIDSSIWNYPLVNITYWSYSSFCFKDCTSRDINCTFIFRSCSYTHK
jgi:hypothetical protein